MFVRKQYYDIIERITEKRRFVQVIAGPRQVGKSTLVKQVLENAAIPYTYDTAESAPDESNSGVSLIWETARKKMTLGSQTEHLLVIDEIHKLEKWSDAVKREWDMDSFNGVNIKVIILGSSRLLIKDGLKESLAGRFELINMEHWSYSEMKEAFGLSLEQYIYFGGYPGGAELIKNESRWRKYIRDSIIEPAITKDVLQTKKIYKPALLRQLFDLGCAYSGELLSYNKVLGMLSDAGNATTLVSYVKVLDESRLLCTLQQYAKDTARKYKSTPKFQVYNTGLFSALAAGSFESTYLNSSKWGRFVESAVGAHLMNLADALDLKIYYWRHNDDEVDYIVERNDKLFAIEVKSGSKSTNKGLSEFSKLYKPTSAFIVGTGGIPLEDFLSSDLKGILSM